MKLLSHSMRLAFGCWILAGINPTIVYAGQSKYIPPEKMTSVIVSNRDVNRFACHVGNIDHIIFSEEKHIIAEINKDNVFIKFAFQENSSGSKVYSELLSEIYITCGGQVFSLTLIPKDINSKTLYLGNSLPDRTKTNVLLYKGLDFEKQIIDLTRKAVLNDIPDTFSVKVEKQTLWKKNVIRGLMIAKVREITPDGVGLRLTEYIIASEVNPLVSLEEADFVRSELGSSIVGITLNPVTVKENQVSHLYVVERIHVSQL